MFNIEKTWFHDLWTPFSLSWARVGSLKLSERQSGQIFMYRMISENFLILDFQLENIRKNCSKS